MSLNVLRIDSGANRIGSVSRSLADSLTARLVEDGATVTTREVSGGLPMVDASWVAAVFEGGDPLALVLSDELVAEVLAADSLILVAPMYNFGIPAAMKSWIDQVLRRGRTFRFTAAGSEGLALNIKKAWIVTATSGVEIGSPQDMLTPYLTAVLRFIGVEDVEVIGAGQSLILGDVSIQRARREIDLTEIHIPA